MAAVSPHWPTHHSVNISCFLRLRAFTCCFFCPSLLFLGFKFQFILENFYLISLLFFFVLSWFPRQYISLLLLLNTLYHILTFILLSYKDEVRESFLHYTVSTLKAELQLTVFVWLVLGTVSGSRQIMERNTPVIWELYLL